MDETEIEPTITAFIADLERAHPDYDVQVLVDLDRTGSETRLDLQAIHRQTQVVLRAEVTGATLIDALLHARDEITGQLTQDAEDR
jgi:5S rRNA maturation endonuclease (ribonuclease M5)